VGWGYQGEDIRLRSNFDFGVTFGDLAEADDSEVIWQSLAYAFTPQDPNAGADLYITLHRAVDSVYGRQACFGGELFQRKAGTAGGSRRVDPTRGIDLKWTL